MQLLQYKLYFYKNILQFVLKILYKVLLGHHETCLITIQIYFKIKFTFCLLGFKVIYSYLFAVKRWQQSTYTEISCYKFVKQTNRITVLAYFNTCFHNQIRLALEQSSTNSAGCYRLGRSPLQSSFQFICLPIKVQKVLLLTSNILNILVQCQCRVIFAFSGSFSLSPFYEILLILFGDKEPCVRR